MEKNRMQFEISGANSYYYMPGEKVAIYADVTFTEDVDGDVLKRAMPLIMKRLPYFAVNIEMSDEGDRYVLRENPLSFPVHEKNGYTDILSDEANDYLFTLNYSGSHIFMKIFHGLTDGMGFSVLISTVIKAYYEVKEDRRFECPNAKSVWETPNEAEWADPMDYLRAVRPRFTMKKQKNFGFTSEKVEEDNPRVYRFSVPEQALVDYAKKYEGGVSGAIALTLARAIDCIELENEQPLRIACPMDMRRMLGCNETLRNCTKSAAYIHSKTLRSMSHEKQLSVLKGQMMLQSSEEYQLPRYEEDKADLIRFNAVKTIEEKEAVFSDVKLKSEPIVSYFGKFDMGELNDRIEDAAIYGKVVGKAGMQSICLCFKGRCYINTSYNLKSESYIRMFANEMRDFSHECSDIYRVEYDNPSVGRKVKLYSRKEFNLCENGLKMNSVMFSSGAKHIKYAVVTLHGFAGHKESAAIERFADRLIEKEPESVVLTFDLPGHGADRERLSLEKCDVFIRSAYEYLRRTCPDAKYILYGTSFGGYLSLKYALEHPDDFDKYTLRCPAVNMYSTLKGKILSKEDITILENGGVIVRGFDMKVKLYKDLLEALEANQIFERDFGGLGGKMLIMQGTADELVNCEDVKCFAKRIGARLMLCEGGDHRFKFGDTLETSISESLRFIMNICQ